jgi:hypothetical protein
MRRAFVAAISLAGLCVVGEAFADDAGIWQFLLGPRGGGYSAAPLPPPSYWPAPPMPAMPRMTVMPPAKKRVVNVKITRPKVIAHAEMPRTKGPVTIYNDRTLQRGDSVVTAQGLRVFKGASHFPYRAADFVSLADASRFVMGDKKQLREIQVAFERIDVSATQFAALVTGRSVSTGQANTKMVEAAGKTIRYVGP